MIKEVYDLGHRDFGENYVQELCEKYPILPEDIKWHMIGHLQSNKCKPLIETCRNLYMVEGVDSIKLADKLNKLCEEYRKDSPLNILVQVNTSKEPQKSGCDENEVKTIVEHVINNCKHLKFCGLMTIGEYDVVADVFFEKLANIKSKLVEELHLTEPLVLSMGMSADWENAIKYGSNNIRVGSAIFGARDYSKMHE